MQSKATTIKAYLASLPADRREVISAIHDVIMKHLPKGYEAGMTYGMIGYYVPHSVYPPGYHCNPKQPLPYANLASQKNHMALYMACVYSDEGHRQWFIDAWKAAGKKLDMGKSCVRFKTLDAVPLDVVGKAIKRISVKQCIASYEEALAKPRTGPKKKTTKKKTAKKKTAKKKAVTKKRTTKKKTSTAASKKKTTKKRVTKKKISQRPSKKS